MIESNFNELMLWIQESAADLEGARLSDFIQESSLDISDINDDQDADVHLMTIHAAKGLEFDYVFVIGCVQGFFPGKFDSDTALEEARRLFCVAMTRAKDILYLCVPEYTYLQDENDNLPAPYIKEINDDLLNLINSKRTIDLPQNDTAVNF